MLTMRILPIAMSGLQRDRMGVPHTQGEGLLVKTTVLKELYG